MDEGVLVKAKLIQYVRHNVKFLSNVNLIYGKSVLVESPDGVTPNTQIEHKTAFPLLFGASKPIFRGFSHC